MFTLTPERQKIHGRAMDLAKRHKNLEAELVEILQQVDRLKIFKALGKNSLFVYATEILDLDKSVAYALITVARRALEVPNLLSALKAQSITLSKASRIVANLTHENDFELAKKNPKAAARDKMKLLSEELVEVKITISRKTFEKLKRAESLQAQKGQSIKWGEVLEACLEVYLDKNDPVRKAKRQKTELLRARVEKAKKPLAKERVALSAEQKHAVFLRDQGKCTHVDHQGQRCSQDKWIEIHHITPISQGGTNDIENLTTLCSFHHDLAHQLTLELEGQITWLRSPRHAYG